MIGVLKMASWKVLTVHWLSSEGDKPNVTDWTFLEGDTLNVTGDWFIEGQRQNLTRDWLYCEGSGLDINFGWLFSR